MPDLPITLCHRWVRVEKGLVYTVWSLVRSLVSGIHGGLRTNMSPTDKGDNYIRKTYVCGYTFLPPENINISGHTRPSAPATKHASCQNGASILLPTYTHQACLPVTPQRIVKIHSSKSPKLPKGGMVLSLQSQGPCHQTGVWLTLGRSNTLHSPLVFASEQNFSPKVDQSPLH